MTTAEFATKTRKLSLEMVNRAGASHIGSALSMVDILAVLYNDIMTLFPKDSDHHQRDRFILSKGHACVSLYATLGLKGYFPLEQLETYGQNNSNFMNHISHKVPGVEFSTGSLGHGLPFATGKALSLKIKGEEAKVYAMLGDGEVGEGSNWEALLFAAHHKLDNLIAIIDYNNLQSLTTVEKTLNIEPLTEKFQSFGCEVFNVDGHNHNSMKKVFKEAQQVKNKPIVVIAKTIKGKGVSYMEDKVKWHYSSPNAEELGIALNELKNA